MITINFAKSLHYVLPKPYRYIAKEHLDRFFNDGIIRISSFMRFRNYPDEVRGDTHEGSGVYMGHDPDKRIQFIVQTDDFDHSYLLSTSLIFDKNLLDKFECDGCFQIIDPLNFSIAISNAILGFTQVLQGFCNYQDKRIISTEFNSVDDLIFKNSTSDCVIGDRNMREKIAKITQTGYEKLFLKENTYQEQAEYRFVWLIDGTNYKMFEHLDLECREAIQFCRKIQF